MRIVTWNVHFGKKIESITRIFKENLILKEADIICFQEIEHHEKEGASRAEKIAVSLGYQCAYAPARNLETKGTHGLAILSRHPMSNIKTVALPKYKMMFNSRDRIAMTAITTVKNTVIQLCNLHLDTRLNLDERIGQIKNLVQELKANAKKIILAGDFNTLPFQFKKTVPLRFGNQRKLLHDYFAKEGFSFHCENGDYTLKRGLVRLDLDAIYLRNMRATACGVEKNVRVSDHLPVWLDVEL